MFSPINVQSALIVSIFIALLYQVDRNLAIGIDSDTVKEICSSEGEPFGFTSPKQVQEVIRTFNNNKSLCPEDYHGSFDDLGDVLGDEVLTDVCGPEAYDHIRKFHSRYISYYYPGATKEQLDEAKKIGTAVLKPIPESLRHFFILFALQISAQCKRNSVQRLDLEVDELVSQKDFDLLKQMKSEASRLMGDDYVEHAKRMQDLVIFDDDESNDAKLYVQVRFGDVIKMAKDACDAKFRPIYGELYGPVVKLNNLGYKDEFHSEEENLKLDFDKKYTRWFGIIETCEVLKDIDVIQDTSSLSAVADLIQVSSLLYTNKDETQKVKNNLNKINLLTEEEAVELKERITLNIERESSVKIYEAKRIHFEHQKLSFTPRMWLEEDSQRKQEVMNFERRVKKLISGKTSYFSLKRKSLFLTLKKKFHKNKIQFKNKDESSAIGRIAAFMDRHRTGVNLAVAAIGLIVMISIHAG